MRWCPEPNLPDQSAGPRSVQPPVTPLIIGMSAQEANPLPDYEVLPLAGMPELELDMQLDGSWMADSQHLAGDDTFWTLPTPFVI